MLLELFIVNWHQAIFFSLLFQFIKVFGWITLVSETYSHLAGLREVFLPAVLKTPVRKGHGNLVLMCFCRPWCPARSRCTAILDKLRHEPVTIARGALAGRSHFFQTPSRHTAALLSLVRSLCICITKSLHEVVSRDPSSFDICAFTPILLKHAAAQGGKPSFSAGTQKDLMSSPCEPKPVYLPQAHSTPSSPPSGPLSRGRQQHLSQALRAGMTRTSSMSSESPGEGEPAGSLCNSMSGQKNVRKGYILVLGWVSLPWPRGVTRLPLAVCRLRGMENPLGEGTGDASSTACSFDGNCPS